MPPPRILPLVCLVVFLACTAAIRTKYKAAVYEHTVVLGNRNDETSRSRALAIMVQNLKAYKKQAEIAAKQGVDIIVFPEDGIAGLMYKNRKAIAPYLEIVPDPREVKWNPCTDTRKRTNTEVQLWLSCIAKNNSMYVVATYGSKVPCIQRTDPKCPKDNQYQYNTAVAFGPDGTLVARYFKTNLFLNEVLWFDYAKPEIITFDTPFGKFGLFICFDAIFYEPGIAMVNRERVANIAYPIAWYDVMPLFSPIGYHSAFAMTMGVNLLAPNLRWPEKAIYGSGIYGPDGPKAWWWNNDKNVPGKLLVAEMDVLSEPTQRVLPQKTIKDVVTKQGKRSPDATLNIKRSLTDTTNIQRSMNGTINIKRSMMATRSSSFRRSIGKPNSYKALGGMDFGAIIGDGYTYMQLSRDSGYISVSNGKVTCNLKYTKRDKNTGELFVVGAFDGLQERFDKFYIQVCVVLKCKDNNISTCGKNTRESNTHFSSIELQMESESKFVFPQIITGKPNHAIGLTKSAFWEYDDMTKTLSTRPDLPDPIIVTSLIGRVFERDYKFKDRPGEKQELRG